MDTARWVALLALSVSLALGCESGAPHDGYERRSAELDEIVPGEVVPDEIAPDESWVVPTDELLLDERKGGARIVGRLEPYPLNADPDRVLRIQVLGPVQPGLAERLEGAQVLDARFVGDAVVTIGADHVLRVHTPEGEKALDREVAAPMSVSGTELAYVRGLPPFFELARADVASGQATQVTNGMAPAWSPAFTPDGAIVFVSGAEGSPRLYRVDRGGEPKALPEAERTPASPIAPRFEDGLLVFEDEQGRAWLDVETGNIVRSEAR